MDSGLMKYLDVYQFIRDRLVPVQLSPQREPEEEETPDLDPIECTSFEELLSYFFAKDALEHTPEIEHCLASMLAVVISTTITGGQLGLRVYGPAGSTKSTLAEALAPCKSLVYARSKFTGFVSGWSSIRKSENIANKVNGKCIIIKDADTLLQLQNLKQIESEIRDAMGDGVIRAEYRTGREFEIHTLFTMIMCGTDAIKQMDDVLLGARFLDIRIFEPGTDAKPIVRRAIKSQFSTIWSQLSGEKSYSNNNGSNRPRKEIILKLAPPAMGFMLHKKQQIDSKALRGTPLTPGQEERLLAMGELTAFMRMKVKRSFDGEISRRIQKEIPSRLGEQFVRLVSFLGIVYQDSNQIKISDKEFAVTTKILLDTADGFPLEIVRTLHKNAKGGCTTDDLHKALGISETKIREIVTDLRETGVVILEHQASNPHWRAGRKVNIYGLTPEIQKLCSKVGL